MRLTFRRRERGDTIVEVMFAVAVFAMLAVGSMSIMNQGTATAQRSLEVTLVREQIDAQAEAIRYIHQAYVTAYRTDEPVDQTKNPLAYLWVVMTNKSTGYGTDSAAAFGTVAGPGGRQVCPGFPSKSFALNTAKVNTPAQALFKRSDLRQGSSDSSVPPFAQVYYGDDGTSAGTPYGIWVQAVPGASRGGVGFVDFHIRACWDAVGSDIPATLGTIVRLYDPRDIKVAAVTPPVTPPTPPVTATCNGVERVFDGDIGLVTDTGSDRYAELLSSSLNGGCTYNVDITYGDDAHAEQEASCKAGDAGACDLWHQPEEWIYIAGITAGGTKAFQTPHTPDVPDSSARRHFNTVVTVPTGQTVVQLLFVHPPVVNPTGIPWIDGNSAHIYAYDFKPV